MNVRLQRPWITPRRSVLLTHVRSSNQRSSQCYVERDSWITTPHWLVRLHLERRSDVAHYLSVASYLADASRVPVRHQWPPVTQPCQPANHWRRPAAIFLLYLNLCGVTPRIDHSWLLTGSAVARERFRARRRCQGDTQETRCGVCGQVHWSMPNGPQDTACRRQPQARGCRGGVTLHGEHHVGPLPPRGLVGFHLHAPFTPITTGGPTCGAGRTASASLLTLPPAASPPSL